MFASCFFLSRTRVSFRNIYWHFSPNFLDVKEVYFFAELLNIVELIVIAAFKIYTSVYALFNGQAGVGNSATTAVFYIYNKFQIVGTPGVAMAATVVLFIIIMFVTFLQRKMMKKIGGR